MGTVEPGWYDDGTGTHRWWDGVRWTGDHVDLDDAHIEVRTDSLGAPPAATPGWFDDGRGRRRWWDGRRWTGHVQASDDAREYGGIVIDGRWIHFGAHSVRVREVVASVATIDAISRRRTLTEAVRSRSLVGPGGPMRAGQFGRLDRRAFHLVVEVAPHLWLTPVAPEDLTRAQQFANWVNACAQHYRYR